MTELEKKVQKVARLIMLIRENHRISIRRIQAEMSLSERTVYRWLKDISAEFPLKIDKGVVTMERAAK